MVSSKYRKRLTVLIVLILLLLGAVLGVTVAYYQDTTGIVKNTFVGGILFTDPEVQFQLLEKQNAEVGTSEAAFKTAKYKLTGTDTATGQTYVVMPGAPIPKRPFVKIEKLLMRAYLFVSVDVTTDMYYETSAPTKWRNKDATITWEMASGWKFLKRDGNRAVYYYTGTGTTGDGLIPGGTQALTIDIMNQQNPASAGYTTGYSIRVDGSYVGNENGFPSITFKAYICQADGDGTTISKETAWATVR